MTINNIEDIFEHPWNEDLLLNLGSVTVGGTPRTSVEKYWKDEIPWMSSGEVHLRRIYDVPGRISKLGLRASNATLVSPPSVAVGLAGQGKTRGTVALVLENICTNQSVALIKSEGDKLNIVYLFYNLEFRYQELRSRSAGGGRAGLSKGILEQLPIPLPQVEEQEKIAEVLSTIDDAIAQTEALIAKQQRIKTGLMQDLLTKGIDENGNIRNEETHEFKDSAIDSIPVEWEVDVLDNLLLEKRYGVSSSLSEEPLGILVLRMNNLVKGEINFSDVKYSNREDAKSLVLNNLDVLFNRTNSIDYVGRTAIYRQQERPVSFASYLVRLVPDKKRLNPEYLNLWLNEEKNKIRVKQLATIGVKQANINPTNLGTVNLAFPKSIVEQKQIVEVLNIGKENLEKYNLSLQKLCSLKTGLMQDLLTGKIRVTSLLENSGGTDP